jgi:AcrR family transcriptional regulator
MLVVRSRRPPDSDLTTRARIRDAAVDLFGRHGFARVTVRQVAGAAGVSAGLVIHHFGSKERLRNACDTAVMITLARAIEEMGQQGPASALGEMARAQEYLPALTYMNRSLVDGGPAAQLLFDRIVEDTERWLASAVRAGTVRPTSDEHARAKLLVSISLGLQILMPYLAPGVEPGTEQQHMIALIAGPALELYTYGLFTSTDYLDAVRKEMRP